MSDERVERVAQVLFVQRHEAQVRAGYTWEWVRNDPAGTIGTVEYGRLLTDARAVVAALDEEPPLEDVLGSDQRFAVEYVGIVQRGDDHWVALVDDARTRKRVEGVGSTIDAAIRAAVANAKEQG